MFIVANIASERKRRRESLKRYLAYVGMSYLAELKRPIDDDEDYENGKPEVQYRVINYGRLQKAISVHPEVTQTSENECLYLTADGQIGVGREDMLKDGITRLEEC
jgi:hypothetical protein